MRRRILVIAAVGLLSVLGCTAHEPLSSTVSLPPDVTSNCQSLCQQAGLRMSSIVIMANAVGCVCEPTGAAPANGATAAAAGVMTIRMAEEEQRNAAASGTNGPASAVHR